MTRSQQLPALGVLISGRGSNLQAIIDAISDGRLAARIAVVVSNVANAPGLERARGADIPTRVVPHGHYTTRGDFDHALARALEEHHVEVVCLAGFMRLLGPDFIAAFPNRILNIHPSLLPAFPGVDAQLQAFTHGAKVTGVTVHFVNEKLDAGPIVMQQAVAVADDDTPESLAARILQEEHHIYPRAIQRVLSGGWRLEGRRFVTGSGPGGAPSSDDRPSRS